jgi:DNA-binding NarL/FixJ family response regulator
MSGLARMARAAGLGTVMHMPASTLLVAGRDRRTRAAIRAALDPADCRVVAEACARWPAGQLLRELEPDVAVVDITLLSTTDFFLTGWGPVSRCTRVVAVGPDDPQLARRLIAHGAAAYVPVGRLGEELAEWVGPTV